MANTENRPWLGHRTINANEGYTVMFSSNEIDTGIIVESTAKDKGLQVGIIGEFDEGLFDYVSPEIVVRLNNDPIV